MLSQEQYIEIAKGLSMEVLQAPNRVLPGSLEVQTRLTCCDIISALDTMVDPHKRTISAILWGYYMGQRVAHTETLEEMYGESEGTWR